VSETGGKLVEGVWKWDITVDGEQVVRGDTRDMEEDEDVIVKSDVGGVDLEKVLGFSR